MDAVTEKITIETISGEKGEFHIFGELHAPKDLIDNFIKRDYADHVRDVMAFEARENDVLLASYLKSGFTRETDTEMDAVAEKITIETISGEKGEFHIFGELHAPKDLIDNFIKRDYADHVRDVMAFEARENDVLLASYIKSGSHWAWEIITMLLNGNDEYIKTDKEVFCIDIKDPRKIDNIPSPRVIGSHYPPKYIPRSIVEKGVKIVHLQRNFKDVVVSFYHFWQKLRFKPTSTLEEFINLVTGTYGIYPFSSWPQYVKEWADFTKQHPDQIINIFYEDMKEDPVREIKRINTFLQCNLNDEIIAKISDACSFNKLKEADRSKEHEYKMADSIMFRKGEVGDWKNWFTVTLNERVDQWLEKTLTNTQICTSDIH